MKPFTLIHAKTLAEASRESAKPDTELKAGGVDLLDRMKEGFDAPKVVVSIAGVSAASASVGRKIVLADDALLGVDAAMQRGAKAEDDGASICGATMPG